MIFVYYTMLERRNKPKSNKSNKNFNKSKYK